MTDKKDISEKDKWMISLWSALVFFVLASPLAFKLVNSLTSMIGITIEEDGCPNMYGLILHSLVFAVVVRIMMSVKLPGVN